ncbi:MAG: GNAT family N-acetyltransferase [Bdellovibrionales bacterium]|nr:GNAT family N-acetyltransferase [Bdellovibrionales bacterium]
MELQIVTDIPRKPPFVKNIKNRWIDLKIRKFQPKVRFEIPFNKYLIKTVDSPFELREVLKLRKYVFFEDGIAHDNFELYDFDKYDLLGDHVVIKNQESGKIVGTYRIMCTHFTDDFYSENEFTIQNFLNKPGVKIELGRACIEPEHRNGATIALIWKGLARFAILVGARYMFGCASLSTINSYLAHEIMRELDRQGHTDHSYDIYVRPEFSAGQIYYNSGLLTQDNIESSIPPLLRSYISAGAKVLGGPAFDDQFQCSDVFTVIDLANMNEKYRRRYF